MEYEPMFPHFGWICPKCGYVYAPTISYCSVCSGENEVTTSNKTEEKHPNLLDIFNPNSFGNHDFLNQNLNQNPLMEDPTPKTKEE